jgi:hypothetical protein
MQFLFTYTQIPYAYVNKRSDAEHCFARYLTSMMIQGTACDINLFIFHVDMIQLIRL